MSDPTPHFWEIFFEVYEPLPRQGPGIGIENALAVCRGLLRPGGYLAFTDAV